MNRVAINLYKQTARRKHVNLQKINNKYNLLTGNLIYKHKKHCRNYKHLEKRL